MVVDKTYENVVKGGLRIKGKLIAKNKKVIDTNTNKPKDVIEVKKLLPKPDVESSDALQSKINQVMLNESLTTTEKTFLIAQIKRSSKKVDDVLKESHREKVEKFNKKLASLSEHFDIPKVGPG
ncbi:hypothetical protein BBOV_III000380 [Babesia bovis T2Bo]|uniref:hypothetical protein n=1 Tax=Babesia bovis T2Bo TaxID=484906 RepID=UPI001C36899D|nr:hypothetical protein BBOV_III000380 [Babesia bovis T2Bo]EDO07605.2 hypothetical protein BBOV_III000380 [Babesia bovis T2Bo]